MQITGVNCSRFLQYSDYPKHDIDKMNDYFKQWKKDKYENILTYRDKGFDSVITGRGKVTMNIPWIKAMDDSLNWFVYKSVR